MIMNNLRSFSVKEQRVISKSYSESNLSKLPSVFQFEKDIHPFGANLCSREVTDYPISKLYNINNMRYLFESEFGDYGTSYRLELPLHPNVPKGTRIYIKGDRDSEPNYYLISIHSNKKGGLLDDVAILGSNLELLAINDRYKPLLELENVDIDINNGNQVIEFLLYEKGYRLFNLSPFKDL